MLTLVAKDRQSASEKPAMFRCEKQGRRMHRICVKALSHHAFAAELPAWKARLRLLVGESLFCYVKCPGLGVFEPSACFPAEAAAMLAALIRAYRKTP